MRQAHLPVWTVPAWTPHVGVTRYPATGAFDLGHRAYLGGIIGLQPDGEFSRGVVTLYWTRDPEGTEIVGVQGMHLASAIVSCAELRFLNRGPYLYLTYEAFSGANGLAVKLFATDIGGTQPLLCGDTILIEEVDRTLAASSVATVYPCDYYAGQALLYLDAPAGVKATLYGVNLTDDNRPLDQVGPGRAMLTVPLGTWFVVVWNPTAAPVTYTLAVTPWIT
jgi:hypothetical protein